MSRRHAAIAAICALSIGTLSVGTTTHPVAAQEADEPVEEVLPYGTLGLELIDHSVDVPANGDLVLTYRIIGSLADAELLFIDQEDDPAPTTTVPGEGPADDATGDEAEEATPPVPLSVDVIVDDRLDEVEDLIGRLGPDAPPSVFPDPIDGIQLADVRPDITIGDDGSATMRLRIGTDTAPSVAERLGIDEPGMYPLLVSMRVGGAVVARHGTVLHRTGERPAIPPVAVSGIGAVSQPTSLLVDDELDPLVAEAARLTEYAATTDLPLWLSIPPDVVQRLTEGTSQRNLIISSLADDTLQGLPATPFDVSSAVAVERDDAFIRQLTIGEEELQAALPGVPVRRDLWYVDRPLSSEAAALLRTSGVRALAMTPDVARTTLTPLPDELDTDRSLAVRLPDGSTLPVLLIDESDALFGRAATDAALAAGTSTEWAVDQLARLRLAAESSSDPTAGRGRLLASTDVGPLDHRLLDELVRLDAATTIYDVIDPGALASAISPEPLEPAPQLPDVAGPSLAGRLDAIDAMQLVVANAASMLPTDDQRPTEWSALLDALVSTAYTDDEADAVLRRIELAADRLTSAIVAPEPFTITLTSRSGILPLTIGNTADEPLRVRIELTSARLVFPDGDPEIVLAPDTATEIEVPVEARTNGTTSVEVRIVSPAGVELTDPVQVSTRVQALSGLAQLLTATLLLLLLTWWLSHWRARRNERDTDHATERVDPPAEDAPTDGEDGVGSVVG